MACDIGAFVARGEPLIWVQASSERSVKRKAVLRAITLDTYRTVFQDFGFGLRQIADIALKALSPAMNDTTTAVLCLDYMESLLSRLASRRIERCIGDENGITRLVIPGPFFGDLVDEPLDEIRIAGASNPRVLGRLLALVEAVGICAPAGPRRARVLAHAARIASTADNCLGAEADRLAVRNAGRRVEAALTSAPLEATPRECA
jgi:uncharacterized membrane protein